MTSPASLSPAQAAARLDEFTVIDVRGPGEYASGHVPGAHNVPLDHMAEALPALKSASARGSLLVVCASGVRSTRAAEILADADIDAATLSGGTSAWENAGHGLDRVTGAKAVWPMERQVRLAAGSLVVAGLLLGRRFPAARWLSAGVGSGLVLSAVTDSCAMAAALSKLPHNRAPRTAPDLNATLEALQS
ncbi:rhodanese-like domain-containing protein [Streptomyces sp. NBC_01218]|uniref:rhodanese-like domain-containing protein n=1 Tax=unclassified Streptomyces TaxID=2593676 RepID=UPI0023BA2530|nr:MULTISPECIES: rhodanese-like domain-containing protein [unclassified Streptomyces]WEH38192.1 rhodanese-like domain-containing protein [Streptomyces sp. AM 2-1-1]WSQ49853.1 rhodanese-like domain-containing protein [Streptomyces sp. NBC_01218]